MRTRKIAESRNPTGPRARQWKRWLLRGVLGFGGVLMVAVAAGLALSWRALGTAPSGALQARVTASPQHAEGVFKNTQAMYNDVWGGVTSASEGSEYAAPKGKLPVQTDTIAKLAEPAGPLRVTWLGHSTTLIEIGGKKILTDPVFGESPFPIPSLGPQRWYPSPAPLEHFKDVDVVLLSHDHYDHLDEPTISRMKDWPATFIAPLGVAAHLTYWGIRESQIVSVDWWDEVPIDVTRDGETHTGGVRIIATPSRHASGRQIFDQMRTLWAAFAIVAADKRVFYSGDTGMFDDLTTIGTRFGPFDLVMVEVGAYHRTWPDWHMGPEQAVIANDMLQGKLFMPIHWGLFDLALHGWTEPMERVTLEAKKRQVAYVTPKPGEVFHPDTPPPPSKWWPDVPWETAEQAPIIATKNGDPAVRYEY